jgi:predicted transcriptional regulator
MTKPSPPVRPTEAEMAILSVLWQRGPSTVRDVHAALAERNTGYTTVLKLMQIMADKGLCARDESQKSHVYRALVDEGRTRRRLVSDFIDRVFAGSAAQLVESALSTKRASVAELDAIRKLLDQKEAEARADVRAEVRAEGHAKGPRRHR